jgi:cobalamin biosynthesis protein CobD/CbiB
MAHVSSRRRQLLTPLTAEVVSAIQSSSSLELARDRISARRDIDETAAARLCRDAIELLNVNLGRQKDAPLIGSPENLR